MRYSGLHSIAGINMEWQKGDVISVYDVNDKSEDCIWILDISKVTTYKQQVPWYKVYNIKSGTTYETYLNGKGSSLIYSLVSRQNDKI
jgi:hypothetical protein